MTRIAKLFAFFFCFALFCSVSSPKANADEWDKKTIVTFSGPVQVGKTKLDAGTYVFKLMDTYDRHVVQISNKEENHVYATVLAIPDYRLEPTDKTVIKFSETIDGTTASGDLPEAGVPIKEWFYPGDNFGQEFKVAPQPVPVETAVVEPLPLPEAAEPAPEPAPAPEAAPPAEPAPEPQATAPAQPETPAPAQTDQQPAPQPAPAPESNTLPKTASVVPLVGLISVLSLALAGGLRAFAKRLS